MSTLREAAQAALEHWDKVSGIFRMTTETNRLRAALAQPETAEPVAWAVTCDGNVTQTWLTEIAAIRIAENLREQNRGRDFDWQTTPLYAHPPCNEWRPASEPPDSDRLVIVWVADDRSPSNGGYFCTDCLRPSRANPDARIWASIGVTHWRDVQPPAEVAK